MGEYIKDMRRLIGTHPLMVAGAAIMVFQEGKVLLQQRSDNKKWGFPGGVMEFGESLEETAKRELFEETGLLARDLKLVEVLSGEKECYTYSNGDEIFGVTVVYSASDITGELAISNEESLVLKYFSLDDLPSPLVDKVRYIFDKHNIS